MKGLELSRKYWEEVGYPQFTARFGDKIQNVAVGMIGPGSECFGFDDDISRDHDWGPGFCLWVDKSEKSDFINACVAWYDCLEKSFRGFAPRTMLLGEEFRVGVSCMQDFYARYTGLSSPPHSLEDWAGLSSVSLATATNGAVFHDPHGMFTDWRNKLLAFYPFEIQQKKIGRLCLSASQSGQYNLKRAFQRNDEYTKHYCLSKFLADSISIVYLLNRTYEPFYKWSFRGLYDLPVLGRLFSMKSIEILNAKAVSTQLQLIEELCLYISNALYEQHMVSKVDEYLFANGQEILLNCENKTNGS